MCWYGFGCNELRREWVVRADEYLTSQKQILTYVVINHCKTALGILVNKVKLKFYEQ